MSVVVKIKGLFVLRHIHKFLVFLMNIFMNFFQATYRTWIVLYLVPARRKKYCNMKRNEVTAAW
jgi:hypothetical protein